MKTVFFIEETQAEILYSSDFCDFSILPRYGQTLELNERKDFRIIAKEQKKETKIEKIEKYQNFKVNQKISVRYRDLKSKIRLKPSEFVLLGLKEKLKAFNDRYLRFGANFADELLTFQIIFIMKEGDKTKVFFQVE